MHPRQLLLLVPLFALGFACQTPRTPDLAPTFVAADAATGVLDPRLSDLLSRYWGWQLEARPMFATTVGVHDFDDRIDDNSPDGLAEYRRRLDLWLAEARSLAPDTLAEEADRTTLELLIEDLEAEVSGVVCQFERWNVNPRGNPVTEWSYLPQLHPLATNEDLARLSSRVRAIGGSVDNEAQHLELGVASGLFPNRESTRRVIEIVKKQLAAPTADWPLVAQLEFKSEDPAFRSRARSEILQHVDKGVRPAFERYLEVLEKKVLPGSRPEEQSGLAALPVGAACYAAQIRRHTSFILPAQQIHDLGRQEIARIDLEMQKLGTELFGSKTLKETLDRLRSDPALYFASEAEVEEKAKLSLANAKAAMPRFFGTLPQADCVVVPIPDYEAPYTTIAYYRPPVPGEKPGEYFINEYAPTTRPRYEAAVLAYHESIPGHHLQIAIAQELPALPAFRRHLSLNVFVEGWALYTERLADEMGLYETGLDRMGMLSFDAWRAARLVVDTGIHSFGWSREQAKQFMAEHTALALNNIDNEVDRYIVWPGQALGYKLGQLEIWRLRREAEAALGDRFSLPRFHDAVLTKGAVSMKLLRAQVEDFISESGAGKAP